MSNRPKQKVLGKSFALSMKKGLRHFFQMVIIGLFRLLTHCIGLFPLIFSFTYKTGGPKNHLPFSLLLPLFTLLLYLFVVGPLYFSKGQVINSLLYRGSANVLGVFSFKHYLNKLKAFFIQLLALLPWSLPLMALAGYLIYMTTVHQNGFAIIAILSKPLGPTASVLQSVRLFVVYGTLLALAIVFCFYGFLRNSSYPYSLNTTVASPYKARQHMVRLLKGRRFAQLVMGIIQLLFALPLVLAALVLLYVFICSKYAAMLSFISSSLPIISLATPWVIPFVVGCALFTLVFLPFIKFFPAAFIKEARG